MKALQGGGDMVAKGKSLWLGNTAMGLIPAYSLTASSQTGGISLELGEV